jgi:adenylosuccinate synthase
MPGWRESPANARSLSDIPDAMRNYVNRIAELVGVQIAMVGIGADREATIVTSNPFAA